MEDRRHTEPWPSAPPSGLSITEDIATLAKRPRTPTPADTDDLRLRGLSIDGRFRIDERIGVGGMSRVYAGLHIQTGVRVAIKLIDPVLSRDPATHQRLLGEAKAMMALQSNHIVRALDVGALKSGQLYIVMEYLEGDNLDAVLASEGPMAWPRVVTIALQICSGLATAHRRKIIHRDIKPQNIFRTPVDDNPEHIKIIDFGVARMVQLEAGPTEQGVLPGTPEYMAPELVSERGLRANESTDIYALGVTLYKLLTGLLPFQGATYMETLRRHVGEPLVPPSKARPDLDIPPVADAIVGRALAKRPAERFASVDELAEALRNSIKHPTAPIAAPEPAPSPRKRPASAAAPQRLLPPSTLIPPGALPPLSLAASAPPRHPRTFNLPFVLLRMSTLMVVSALFAAGTFAIQPTTARTKQPPPAVPATKKTTPSKAPTPPGEPTVIAAAPIAPIVDSKQPEPLLDTKQPAPLPDSKQPEPPTDAKQPAPPTDTKQPAPPASDPLPPEPLSGTKQPAGSPPPAEPQPPVDPPPGTTSSAPTADTPAPTEPEPDFGYGEARKLIEEQLTFMRSECLVKQALKRQTKIKFRFDVKSSGKAKLQVFSSDKGARTCIRGLFTFPFEKSPRGGAFEYTFTATTGTFDKVPVDPDFVK